MSWPVLRFRLSLGLSGLKVNFLCLESISSRKRCKSFAAIYLSLSVDYEENYGEDGYDGTRSDENDDDIIQ